MSRVPLDRLERIANAFIGVCFACISVLVGVSVAVMSRHVGGAPGLVAFQVLVLATGVAATVMSGGAAFVSFRDARRGWF